MTINEDDAALPHTRRASRLRTRGGQPGDHQLNPIYSNEDRMSAGKRGWNTQWSEAIPERGEDGEVAQSQGALASIAPTMLRGPRHSIHSTSNTIGIRPQLAPSITYGSNNPGISFVNSTVEILQNQIRKEEAPKKKRTRTSPEQLRILQKAFTTDPMPNSSSRMALAKKLGMNARAVQVWFQNRRAKEKLDNKRTEKGRDSGPDGADPSDTQSYTDSPNMSSLQLDRSLSLGAQPLNRSGTVPDRNFGPNRSKHYSYDTSPQMDMAAGSGPQSYDLGMYFGDPSLANYVNAFDMGLFQYGFDPNQPHHLFDDQQSFDPLAQIQLDPSKMQNSYHRYQSMPAALSYPYGDTPGTYEFNSAQSPDNYGAGHHGQYIGGYNTMDNNRPTSIDVLGGLISGAENCEIADYSPDQNNEDVYRAFSTPNGKDAFITAPLGQSIPMKQRSQSVPEIPLSLRSSAITEDMIHLFRGSDLGTIREEDHLECPPPPHPSKRPSNAGVFSLGGILPSVNELRGSSSMTGFPPISGSPLDDIQTYLDCMVTNPRFDLIG